MPTNTTTIGSRSHLGGSPIEGKAMRDIKGFAFLGVSLVGIACLLAYVVLPVVNAVAPVASCQKAK